MIFPRPAIPMADHVEAWRVSDPAGSQMSSRSD